MVVKCLNNIINLWKFIKIIKNKYVSMSNEKTK